jgi:hypothetical protein
MRRAMVRFNKRFWQVLRSKRAVTVAELEVQRGDFHALRRSDHCLVVTYRRDGRPVAQPVWPGYEGGRIYVWTEEQAFKAKRVRNNPDALVAACSWRGVPRGLPIAARGRVLEPGPESEHAARVIAATWGPKRKLFALTSRPVTPVVYLEFVPA